MAFAEKLKGVSSGIAVKLKVPVVIRDGTGEDSLVVVALIGVRIKEPRRRHGDGS